MNFNRKNRWLGYQKIPIQKRCLINSRMCETFGKKNNTLTTFILFSTLTKLLFGINTNKATSGFGNLLLTFGDNKQINRQ